MTKDFTEFLAGNDLRSLGKNSEIFALIKDQKSFDKLFGHLYNNDRAIVMKTIDLIEKITLEHKEYLQKYKLEIIKLCEEVKNIELKWHLAQLLARLKYTNDEIKIVKKILEKWVQDKKESKIVRVNSLQSLYELEKIYKNNQNDFIEIVNIIKQENIASVNARIKKLGI